MDLDYDFISSTDDFSSLHFTEKDGADLLGVDEFAKQKSIDYHNNKLSTVRIVRYKCDIVGYFAVSMSAISVEDLEGMEKVAQVTPLRYPAMLLGQLGVDVNYQGQGIGSAICDFCLGLAQVIGEKVA